MRLTNFLLVAAAVLLASCEAVSAATDSTQAQLSTMASPNALQSIDTVNGGKRFLRITKTEKYDDEDEESGLGYAVKEKLHLKHTNDLQDPNTQLYNLFVQVYARKDFKVYGDAYYVTP
ncbi:hypothetical protein BBO99_00009808 [Phytophthora kernoviae]|uniref:RxLR effector protein n=2 Tax=Phytophthora kernoviae TaxID=325452 RepID=A0A421FH47_9STRA|nr:hypothetical protein G195_011434 [Phytophthora kernoviae 00238/432]KAG2502504.1 hypothetical protein JM16_009772 [Phytophthora kernoviae]RLN44890.1 hypothetical protein BBI17_009867 [Phytophthora kernoviae]RLN72420.1 hypothetical protein BBO99_00009808 [Phytophthora kernoviae]